MSMVASSVAILELLGGGGIILFIIIVSYKMRPNSVLLKNSKASVKKQEDNLAVIIIQRLKTYLLQSTKICRMGLLPCDLRL